MKMNCFKLAFSNFKRNAKSYSLYLFAMIFSVAVYYNFVSLKYNPQLLSVQSVNQYVKPLAECSIIIFILFLIFFIWFSNSLFLKQRKREVGIYAFMGVDNSSIGKMFAAEIFIMGVVSLAAGLFIGILVSKLFVMLLSKIALLNVVISFYISYKALLETTGIFLLIFLLVSLKGYVNISRSKLIDLFNAAKKEEELPKINHVKALLSIVIIGVGYYFALNAYGKPENFSLYVLLAIILLILGTYWLLGSFYPMMIRHLIKNKKVLYNGTNVVSISNTAFRIKDNYKTLAAVAILITCTITAFGTAYSLRYYVENEAKIQKPYTFSYITSPDDMQTNAKVKNVLKNESILHNEKVKFIVIDKYTTDARYKSGMSSIATVRFSDFKKVSKSLDVDDLNNILNDANVKRGKVSYLQFSKTIITMGNVFGENIFIDGNKYKYCISGSLKTPMFGLGVPMGTLVMNDNDYNLLKQKFNEYEFNGIKIKSQNDIAKVSSLTSKLKKIDTVKDTLYSPFAVKNKDDNAPLMGLVYFMGSFLALVFVMATGSIICFKFLSEAYMDKDKYKMLGKIGMTENEIHSSISKQIGISYSLPLIIGIIHSMFAIKVLSQMLKYNIIFPAAISVLIFTLIYFLFFIFTTRKIFKITE